MPVSNGVAELCFDFLPRGPIYGEKCAVIHAVFAAERNHELTDARLESRSLFFSAFDAQIGEDVCWLGGADDIALRVVELGEHNVIDDHCFEF